jgi:hypothetical protein
MSGNIICQSVMITYLNAWHHMLYQAARPIQLQANHLCGTHLCISSCIYSPNHVCLRQNHTDTHLARGSIHGYQYTQWHVSPSSLRCLQASEPSLQPHINQPDNFHMNTSINQPCLETVCSLGMPKLTPAMAPSPSCMKSKEFHLLGQPPYQSKTPSLQVLVPSAVRSGHALALQMFLLPQLLRPRK